MIKSCSLDFLNEDFFENDILDSNGKILFHAGDEVTPSIISRLYFKEIYIDTSSSKKNEKEIKIKNCTDIKPVEKLENGAEFLKFDEMEAEFVAKYAKLIGQFINLSEIALKELETAAFYHNIGRTKLKHDELKNNDVKKIQAEHSYNILLNEKKLSPRIADAVKLYNLNYDPKAYQVAEKTQKDIPFHHIISIASFYYNSEKKSIPKNKILEKMMQIGDSKFNIFILHKFINMMQKMQN